MPYSLIPVQRNAANRNIRVLLRELYTAKSTEEHPYQSMEKEQKLTPVKIVPVDVLIWPMGMKFNKVEILQLIVSAYKTMKI